MEQIFDEEQIKLLEAPLDPRFVSSRKGGGNTTLKYIEGHDALDQANRIFQYGNWSYRPLSCEQCVLQDPLTGEAVGVCYKAQVELIVRGCIAPIVEVGSQPVATWNVEDCIMKRRMNDAKYNKKPLDESPFSNSEKAAARGTIVDAHEMAEKGAVTDALKRALRTFGDQFGNGLYGDGRVDLSTNLKSVKPLPDNPEEAGTISEQQADSIKQLCLRLKKSTPENMDALSFMDARKQIQTLKDEYRTAQAASKAS